MKSNDTCDTIFLTDLRVRAIIGINDWERRVRQTVSIDLEMPADAQHAAKSDEIDATVNYKAVAKRLIAYIADSEFYLIETLSERIAEICLNEFHLDWVRVSVHKPGAIRGAKDVGIAIRRGNLPGAPKTRREVYVSIGSNVQAEQHIAKALSQLTERFGPLRRSAIYRNAAVGFEGDDFLNMVAGFESSEEPEAIVAALGHIEQECGRVRGGSRFSARTMDLDLLLCGQLVSSGAGLTLPRPELLRQVFILRPLAELAGTLVHPVEQRSFASLWQDSDLANHDMTLVDINYK